MELTKETKDVDCIVADILNEIEIVSEKDVDLAGLINEMSLTLKGNYKRSHFHFQEANDTILPRYINNRLEEINKILTQYKSVEMEILSNNRINDSHNTKIKSLISSLEDSIMVIEEYNKTLGEKASKEYEELFGKLIDEDRIEDTLTDIEKIYEFNGRNPQDLIL